MLIRVPPWSGSCVSAGAAELIGATQGAAFWLWPWENYLRFPSTLQWMLFLASQITREHQGVDVKGAFSWRIVDPLLAYQNLNMQRVNAAEATELLSCTGLPLRRRVPSTTGRSCGPRCSSASSPNR